MPQAAESRSAPYCQKTARIVLHALDIADCRDIACIACACVCDVPVVRQAGIHTLTPLGPVRLN